ncbi:MAG TPA: polysaccharide deacetylase family protein [Baekduia sp.]|uniref:polysaccharide deacetylase family protein n=1 Tax=Baekduia sp. TaxID=2600305 RepID=UPI002C750235|nr:polysaccharide deacetylase family protein [Baekduia sp.]HMJ36406.1 polysaccharide deacetylase family protein [Baekduia sp.]
MRIAVAVVTVPGRDAGPAVAALRAAGIEDVAVVATAAPGAWAAARNAALEDAGDGDVLALIDHDVRVDPGWGAALRAAWVAPGARRVGAVGGPLRGEGAPAWHVGDHAEVLALHDGAVGPFPGGNVSFRTSALRGVGGFFPARGHAAARDTVGEDRRAQRDLEAAGWSVVGAAGMSAARDLSALRPVDLLRRRLHAGARSAALGGAARGAGLSLAARAGAAAAARAVRRDRAGAVDRAAWAAHGAGTVLGRPLAHAGLQPDRERTALRPDVPPAEPHPWAPAPRLVARRRGRGRVHGAVLLYHRVAALGADPLGLAVTPEHFAQQLAVLRERWTVVGLEAVVRGEAGDHAVALTFDDGYHDNLLHALPALTAAGVPATLFCSTGHVATGEAFWWDAVTAALSAGGAGILELDLPEGRRAWAPRDDAHRAAVRAHAHAALRTRDRETIATALAQLDAWATATTPAPADVEGRLSRDSRGSVVPRRSPAAAAGPPPERDRPMTVAELRALAAAGPFAVQAHGRTHRSLAHAPAAAREDELRGSADDLEAWLGARPTAFSYPFGVPGVDVDEATREAARAAGYAYATVNAPGLVRAGTDRYALPRLAVGDLDGGAFARWLDATFPGR